MTEQADVSAHDLPGPDDDPVGIMEAIVGLATRVVSDLRSDHDQFSIDTAESWSVGAWPLYGEIKAVTAWRSGLTVVMVNSDLRPIQQLQALLVEIDAGLGLGHGR